MSTLPALPDNFCALIVGASGFVGRRMTALLGNLAIPTFLSRPMPGGVRFDAQTDSLRDILQAMPKPASHVFVLYGAIDMEGCAADPQGTEKVNVDSVQRMIRDICDFGALPIYASTDYIFDGSRGLWREDDAAHPVMEYGRQKRMVEDWLRSLDAPWLAARFSKVVSGERGTHSMLGQWVGDIEDGSTMRCATDQVFSPCWVDDVANLMVKLAVSGETGLFNLAGETPWSRWDLLQCLVGEISKLDPSVRFDMVRASLHDMPFREKRPLDTSLDISKLKRVVSHDFKSMPALCAEVALEHFAKSG